MIVDILWIGFGVVFLIGAVAAALYLCRTEGAHGFPGVTQVPFFGAMLTVTPHRDRIRAFSHNLVAKHGYQTCCLTSPGKRIFMTSTADDLRVVLGDPVAFCKGDRFRWNFEELLGGGIFNADGDLWASQRKAASHLFAASRLRQFEEEIFVRDAELLASLLLQKQDQVLDLQNLLYALSVDSFCTLAFGESFHALQQTLDDNDKPDFLHAFDVAVGVCAGRFITPPPITIFLKLLSLSHEGEFKTHIKLIDEFVYRVVDKVLAMKPEELEQRNDLLGLYVNYAHKTADSSMLDRKFLRDVAVNFILAGRDTTASTLTSMVRLLAHFPAQRDRVEQEVDNLAGPLTFDALSKSLPFMDAVVAETLRLFPPVPSSSKSYESDEPCSLSSGPSLRRGDVIGYQISGVQRNPRYWEAPDDFVPNRWIAKDGTKDAIFSKPAEQHAFYFPAFNAGRRVCLGKVMAQIEAKSCLATLVRAKLRFELVGDDDLSDWDLFSGGAVIALRAGLQVKISKRT